MNPPLLLALSALELVLFPIPIVTLFWKDQIGMSLTEVMLLQAAFGLAVVVCEFPSGYLADRVGYRTSLLAGGALWTLGWLGYALGGSFGAILLADVVRGAGAAFVSGADRAMLWASLAATGRGGEYTRWEGRARAAAQTSEAVSAGLGGWLYALWPRLPFWLQVPTSLAALACMLGLEEVPRAATSPSRSHLGRAWQVVRFALGHRRLRAAMALAIALGLSSFVMVWLIQPYMQ